MSYINKLILGTVQLGLEYGINNIAGKPAMDKAVSILSLAYEKGIRCLDTAEAYGNAQEVIGYYHKSNCCGKYKVITKLRYDKTFENEAEFQKHFLKNLEVLNVSFIDAYMFHNFETYQCFPFWHELQQLMEQNLVKKIGISVYTNEQALEVALDERIKVVQLPFNLLDNYSLRGNVLALLKKQQKEVHIRSVFLQGLFYKDRDNLGSLSPLKENLKQLDILSKKSRLSIGSLALAYCLRQPYIDKVLIGVETEAQLIDNVVMAAEADKIDQEVLKSIDYIQVAAPRLLNPNNWQ
jgi:uncharacterized protein